MVKYVNIENNKEQKCVINYKDGYFPNQRRHYSMLTKLSDVNKTVYNNDIIPQHIWNQILLEYFNQHVNNKFVLYILRYITSKQELIDSVLENRDNIPDDVKLKFVNLLIAIASKKAGIITGVLSDLDFLFTRLSTVVSTENNEDEDKYDDDFGDVNYKQENLSSLAKHFAQSTGDINRTETESSDKQLKTKPFNAYNICVSILKHNWNDLNETTKLVFLYYYHHVDILYLENILSEFSNKNILTTAILHLACIKFISSKKDLQNDELTLTTPLEFFKSEYLQKIYIFEEEVTEEDEDKCQPQQNANNSLLSFPSTSNSQDGEIFDMFEKKKKRKSTSKDGSDQPKKKSKRKVINPQLITTITKLYWKPYSFTGSIYLFNGKKFECADKTIKNLSTALGCNQAVFSNISKAPDFTQTHGRNYIYLTNMICKELKTPLSMNVLLKIYEHTLGCTNSMLEREYPCTPDIKRHDLSIYNTTVDGLNGIIQISKELDLSAMNFLLCQPVFPVSYESNLEVKNMFEEMKGGYISLNIYDYKLILNTIEKLPEIDKFLDFILKKPILKCPFNLVYNWCLVCIIRALRLNSEVDPITYLNIDHVIVGFFGKSQNVQIGWLKNLIISNSSENTKTTTDYDATNHPNDDDEDVFEVPLAGRYVEHSAQYKEVLEYKAIFDITKRIARMGNNYNIKPRYRKEIPKFVEFHTSENNCCDDNRRESVYLWESFSFKNSFEKNLRSNDLYNSSIKANSINESLTEAIELVFKDESLFKDQEFFEKIRIHNLNQVPKKIKLLAFTCALHFFKRNPVWEGVKHVPSKIVDIIQLERVNVLLWLNKLGHKYFPERFWTGEKNEDRESILSNYINKHDKQFSFSYHNPQVPGRNKIFAALFYLYYVCSFDIETVLVFLKIILSLELPGQWGKQFYILCGHRHAGKSKLLELLLKYAQASCTIEEPRENVVDNKPETILYLKNLLSVHDEVTKAPNTLKRIISETKISFRNNHGNVFAQIYALSKLVFTCNEMPQMSDDAALLDRAFYIPINFCHLDVSSRNLCEFRWFPLNERVDLKDMYKENFPSDIAVKDGALPFTFFNKKYLTSISSALNEKDIIDGFQNITLYFSWFYFVKNLKTPVNLNRKCLPEHLRVAYDEWLRRVSPYEQWKNDVQISKEGASGEGIAEEIIKESLRTFAEKYGKSAKISSDQLFNAFRGEFCGNKNEETDRYNVVVNLKKLINI